MYQANSFSWHCSGASNGDERCFTDYLVLPDGHCEVSTLNFVCLSYFDTFIAHNAMFPLAWVPENPF